MCVSIFSITFVWNISYAKKNWARYDQKYVFVFIPLFLSDFNETRTFLDRFSKNIEIQNFTKICLVGAKFFHAAGQTDRHDEANSHFSQFCERE